MTDTHFRIEGRAGRITLNRPEALNALTHEQVLDIEKYLLEWRDDDAVELIIIDGEGERAFCAGGDIQDLYETGRAGDFAYGKRFWADEYRLNALIWNYPKPYVAIMHGFVMGGGVGVSALGSHRIVTDGTQVAMPECGIGLIPDVGGSLLLGCAPGRLGEYLGTTAARMGPADAIRATFADTYVPADRLDALKNALCIKGVDIIPMFAQTPEPGPLEALQPKIDEHFGGERARDIINSLVHDDSDFAKNALKALRRNAPLAVACAVETIHRAREFERMEQALALEYRFTSRCMEHGEFLEGVRAAVIDKDRTPKWAVPTIEELPGVKVSHMLQPLGADELKL
ncbi:enoyl-CoA hydratase/isomerase family protein [Pontivivens insulae]|uniref:3-hydroxyisobutyryl-CoA hydrolase n=1 Tax=Pontivivens insulae TaxID=1639689 RepID=A0A2R8A788_9RHOB|nr:enoyl-CoA hydratase/isomerase family protein [Pontivivens insulae]RED18215.1 enoyl-CoA hydratase [Pontivivens insulae]SPF28113.1 Short-chain-enoyl-CoA hydratase [Pontivivens insulae]